MNRDWTRLFGKDSFRWQIGLRPGNTQAFFAPTDSNREILAERAALLAEASGDYAALLDSAQPLLEETHAFLIAAGVLDAKTPCSLEAIGRALEPDFVLMQPSPDGLVVAGGVVCFPSSWSLPEKLGRSLHETHSPVPNLNPQLGDRIRTALDRLAPGVAWERENWGLARDGNRNHHVQRPRRRLDDTIQPDELWLRVEPQILCRLPVTGGILFGIRIEIARWRDIMQIPEAAAGFRRALESMPDDAAAYKGLLTARPKMLEWLAAAA